MQLNLTLATKEEIKKSWAFARKTPGRARNRSIITACSAQARALGIRAGMQYQEAKALIPDMRILIYNR